MPPNTPRLGERGKWQLIKVYVTQKANSMGAGEKRTYDVTSAD